MPPSVTRHRYYLGGAFLVEHRPPAGSERGPAVVVLPPLGYEDTSAYRSLRNLADALAARGHVVVRVDWPGLGDSVGSDATPGLVERMVAAATDVGASLRERGATRVAAVGVRAGALLALATPGFDDVVLWAPPLTGKALMREERAFQTMAMRYFGTAPPDVPSPPEGAVEAGGFLYRAETVAALEALVATDLVARRPPGRALLIPRDAAEPPAALLRAFQDAGTALVLGPAEGLADLIENPYETALAPAVRDAVIGFLSTDAVGTSRAAAEGDPALLLPDGVREFPWIGRGAVGELSGIVCEPAGGAPVDAPWTIFFNAGGIRRVGPNRIWTRAARDLAAQGLPSLRFDVHDVGDSDGAALPHSDLEEMYSAGTIDDALRAVDYVQDRGAGSVDVVGLCSGAYFGMQVAAQRSIRHATLINGPAYVWNEDAKSAGMTNQISRSLVDGRRWKRLVTGRIDARVLAASVATEARLSAGRLVSRLRGDVGPDEVTELIRRVERRGTRIHFISSAEDPSIAYLDRHLAAESAARRTVIPGVDHTIRPIWAHSLVTRLIVAGGKSDSP